MSLLDKASLVVTPNAYKEDVLYSVIPLDGSGDLDVTRATTATRVNSDGLIEVTPYNLLQQSQTFDNVFWSTLDSSVVANSTIAPNGTNTAFSLLDNTSNFVHAIIPQISKPSTEITYSFSIFAKYKDIGKKIQLSFDDAVAGGVDSGIFNLSTGEWDTAISTPSASFTNASRSFENIGNGWYRLILKVTSNSQPQIRTNIFVANASNQTFYIGNGTGIYIWGAQVVQGTSAKEYFPTTDRLNVPRIDYTGGGCPSILVEPQRTNLALYSEQFDNAFWNKTNCTIGANAVTSPSGLTNADNIITTSANSDMGVLIATVTANTSVYTQSGYFKWVSGYEIVKFRIALAGGSGQGAELIFNSRTGTFVSSNTTYKIESVGNGWFRVSLQITNNGTNTLLITQIYPTNETTQTQTISFWGVQMELGSYATSYIPTVASTVTRNADVISKTGISDLIGQTEGTIYWEGYLENSNSGQLIGIEKSGTDVIRIQKEDNNNLSIQIYNNGFVFIKTFNYTNGLNKIAFVYKSGNSFCYLNGVKVAFDTSAFTNSGILSQLTINNLWINYSDITLQRINSAMLFKEALTDEQLIALTTI